jgi:hypothetical protein
MTEAMVYKKKQQRSLSLPCLCRYARVKTI